VPGKEVELDKELVLRDLEHLLKEGHGELIVKVADHKIADIKYDVHRISKGGK
jgi:hypothetical protein